MEEEVYTSQVAYNKVLRCEESKPDRKKTTSIRRIVCFLLEFHL